MTEVLAVDPSSPEADRIARAAGVLQRGGLVAFPTETVYGLGVHALDRAAVRRLFAAKGRPSTDPLIVHVASLDHARDLVATLPPTATRLAARFWPGSLTLVLRRTAAVPDEVTAGLDTVAVRVPAHPVARALLEHAALPIAAPSANLFSRPSPTTAAHVLADLDGRIDLIVDGGPSQVGVESTVLDISGDVPTVLRPGAVTLEMLRDLLPGVRLRSQADPHQSAADGSAMRSPGLLTTHYAPRTALTLFQGDIAHTQAALASSARELTQRGSRVVVLAFAEIVPALRLDLAGLPLSPAIVEAGALGDMPSVANRLYAALREADGMGADVLLMCDVPGDGGLADAIRDRLQRAAAEIRRT